MQHPNPNFQNRSLYQMDNLAVLRGINSGTIDLIATDPPFNKGRDFHATPESVSAGASFKDRWSWRDDVHPEWLDRLQDGWTATYLLIDSVRGYDEPMAAYMSFMAVRLMEMRRILKPTGSIYLHCDPTANAYLRLLMDTIFGAENFRNEVVWSYRRWAGKSRQYQRMHDTILFYSNGAEHTWNWPMEPKAASTPKVKRWNERDPETGKLTTYADETIASNDTNMRDVWEMSWLQSQSRERVGYPTQKPLALYERIIKASSNPGDLVLDRSRAARRHASRRSALGGSG